LSKSIFQRKIAEKEIIIMEYLCPVIHVVEQNGFFHSVGEQGQSVCKSSMDLTIFAEDLYLTVDHYLSLCGEGARVEVYFRKDGEEVRFSMGKGPRNSRFIDMISEIPFGEEQKRLLDHFLINEDGSRKVLNVKRENRLDYLKHVRIIKSPFSHLANLDRAAAFDPFPDWIGEACIGLEFNPARLCVGDKDIIILPDDWIGALKLQNPHGLSPLAAKWINEHVYFGGGITTPIENVEILGVGRLLENGQECYQIPEDEGFG